MQTNDIVDRKVLPDTLKLDNRDPCHPTAENSERLDEKHRSEGLYPMFWGVMLWILATKK